MLFRTKSVQKDNTNAMEKRKNMSLDDVNESIDQELTSNKSKGKINSQKNDEIQKNFS